MYTSIVYIYVILYMYQYIYIYLCMYMYVIIYTCIECIFSLPFHLAPQLHSIDLHSGSLRAAN